MIQASEVVELGKCLDCCFLGGGGLKLVSIKIKISAWDELQLSKQ